MQGELSRKSELFFHPSSRGRAWGFWGGCTKELTTEGNFILWKQRLKHPANLIVKELVCGCKIIPVECGHRRRWVTAESPRETPEGPSNTPTSSRYSHTGVQCKLHRAEWQEKIAIPSLPGPASCCFHCTLPAKAICLASTKPVWRSGPHGASGSFANHLTSSLFLFVFIFLHHTILIHPSKSPAFFSLSLFLFLWAGSYSKQDAVAVYPGRGVYVQVVLLCGML